MTLAHELRPPDVEKMVYDLLADLGGIKVWAVDSAPYMHAIVEQTTVQVDARASSKARARDRAYDARVRLLSLPGGVWQDGIVYRVDIVQGPAWIPDDDGAPRYVLRATLHYRNNGTAPIP